GRLELADAVENRAVVKVDSDHGVTGLGMLRLLFNADDAAILEYRHSEPLRVGNLLEQDLGAVLALEALASRPNPAFDDVVAQDHAEPLPGGEFFRQAQGVG